MIVKILIAVLIFGITVIIHELGHFLLAKANGITVTEFSIGFGPTVVKTEKGGTIYSLKLLPFGGSCAMLGEDEDAEGDRAFNNKPVFNRIAVVAGGPLFNFLLAFLLSLVIVGCAGGFYEPVVVGVEKGYPAEQVGILPGDVITKVNHRSVHSYRDLTPYLTAHPHQDVTITWKHTDENGKTEKRSAKITPVYIDRTGQSMIGVRFDATLQKITNPAQSDGDTRSLCSTLCVGAINFCACAESSEHSFTGQTPEPDHNDNAATNEPCAASYCISLSNSMGNRALTTEEA